MIDLSALEQQPQPASDEPDEWPVVRVLTTATGASPLESLGPCSVFDLARVPVKLRSKLHDSGNRPPCRIERMGEVTRCTLVQLNDTAEWKDREAARRARQTPPKPGAKVKASMNAMKAPGRGWDVSETRA